MTAAQVARFYFGKHRGRRVADVDSGYLAWCLSELTDLSPDFRDAIEEELERRHDSDEGDDASEAALVAVAPVVKQWYREMIMRHHPDRGGSTVAMQAVNDAHERLRELLRLSA